MNINIEDETIEMSPGKWFNETQLRENIKGKVDIGNFDVVEDALALKELTTTVGDYVAIELKLPREFVEASKQKAEMAGLSFWEYIRTNLMDHQ